MNKETASQIDDLIYDSGLFPSKTKKTKTKYSFDFSDEVILITGAAGSIGTGLTKQLINSRYKKLILIDKAESPLYELIKELEFEDISNVEFILNDITDKKSLKYLFKTHNPTLVFHTAAYKHVPLMESNAYQAVKLNIFGTKLLADLSIEYKVKKFIFISTDKAVNPISVMGITKHIGENYLNFLNSQSDTLFVTARFGNILGSNGSVVPLFKNQIEKGNPITITDTSISRYFISKYKACNLILKLATLQQIYNYSLFTFNMGSPIRITHIIERILSFYKNLENSPEIKIIGLRPGEKLHEDMISAKETCIKTEDSDILAVIDNNSSQETIDFSKLQNVTPCMTNTEIKNILLKYI